MLVIISLVYYGARVIEKLQYFQLITSYSHPIMNITLEKQKVQEATLVGLKPAIEIDRSYRRIQPFHQDHSLPSNKIRTSKYTWYDFIPKNLYEQFTKLPNIYFLIISVLQIIPYTTNTDGIPYIYIPLGIILLITAIKDIYEDYHRAVLDDTENNQPIIQITHNGQALIKSQDIRVGMLIVVKKGKSVPCDGVLMHSEEEFAYVQTKCLDGETNLKRKHVHPAVKKAFQFVEHRAVVSGNLEFQIEPPNNNLLTFSGVVNSTESVTLQNFIYRSSKLQNPAEIVILATYTGHESKVLLNMNKPIFKKTTLTNNLGYAVLLVFGMVVITSLVLSFYSIKSPFNPHETATGHFLKFWASWILAISNFVPISLMVTIEVVKILQGKLMEKDPKLASLGIKPIVNVSSVLEDLGSITHLASDKTGTLTKNILKFKQLSVNGAIYTQTSKINPELLIPLGLCHETCVSPSNEYQGVSQDEICILNYCYDHGFEMLERTPNKIKFKTGIEVKEIEILKVLEFSSERKRQSIIFKDDEKAFIFCKGADDVMNKRIVDNEIKAKVHGDLNYLASMGRRTLIYAFKELRPSFAQKWVEQHNESFLAQQFDLVHSLEQNMEVGLEAICATGIEDELQDEVQETIRDIVTAGIKFIIISGDKPETVFSIASNLNIAVPFLPPTKQYRDEYKNQALVVFARCTPKQKSAIVDQISKTGRVLAIGDGANDVAMLTSAAVGIGIKGKEGMAASQAADIGVSQFKHLRRLLFYYGAEINRRNSILIKYNFYKNFVYAFPQIAFGFYSAFTAVALYQPIVMQIFNLFYTALPIGAFALFDQSQEQQTLMSNQDNIYQKYQLSETFGYCDFFLSLIESVIQASIGCYFCYTLMSQMYRSPDDLTLYETSTIFTLFIVLLTNQKILMYAKKLTIGFLGSMLIGAVSYFISIQLISQTSVNLRSVMILFRGQTFAIVLMCFVVSLLAHHLLQGIAKLFLLARKRFRKRREQQPIMPFQSKQKL